MRKHSIIPYLRFTAVACCGLCRSCATNESTCFARSISPCNCASSSNSDHQWANNDVELSKLQTRPGPEIALNMTSRHVSTSCLALTQLTQSWFQTCQVHESISHLNKTSCLHLLVHAPLLDHLLWIAYLFITLEFQMGTSATSDPFFEATGKVTTVAWYQSPIHLHHEIPLNARLHNLIWPPNVLL